MGAELYKYSINIKLLISGEQFASFCWCKAFECPLVGRILEIFITSLEQHQVDIFTKFVIHI